MNTPPLRVINVIARLNIGGTAMHVILLTAGLNGPDWHSTLVSGRVGPQEGDMAYLCQQYGVEPLYLDSLGRALHPVRDLHTLFSLVRLFRREHPHVVHTHTAKAGFVGRLAARLAGVPVIVHTFHGHIFEGYFSRRKTRFFLALEQLSARYSDCIITVSSKLKQDLAEQYHLCPPEKIAVLPLALDLETFARSPRKTGLFRAQWGIPPAAPLIGLVGRMVAIKRHDLLIRAVVEVKATIPDVHVVLVGDGELRQAIEQQVQAHDLAGHVTFTGWLNDLAGVYADLDLLVMCSDNEGTPVSAIEALAAGVPLVGTAVGGLPDLLEDGRLGKLVPRNDAPALAGAIIATLHNTYNAPASNEVRTSTQQRYSSVALHDQITALYTRLLRPKGIIPIQPHRH